MFMCVPSASPDRHKSCEEEMEQDGTGRECKKVAALTAFGEEKMQHFWLQGSGGETETQRLFLSLYL